MRKAYMEGGVRLVCWEVVEESCRCVCVRMCACMSGVAGKAWGVGGLQLPCWGESLRVPAVAIVQLWGTKRGGFVCVLMCACIA